MTVQYQVHITATRIDSLPAERLKVMASSVHPEVHIGIASLAFTKEVFGDLRDRTRPCSLGCKGPTILEESLME